MDESGSGQVARRLLRVSTKCRRRAMPEDATQQDAPFTASFHSCATHEMDSSGKVTSAARPLRRHRSLLAHLLCVEHPGSPAKRDLMMKMARGARPSRPARFVRCIPLFAGTKAHPVAVLAKDMGGPSLLRCRRVPSVVREQDLRALPLKQRHPTIRPATPEGAPWASSHPVHCCVNDGGPGSLRCSTTPFTSVIPSPRAPAIRSVVLRTLSLQSV